MAWVGLQGKGVRGVEQLLRLARCLEHELGIPVIPCEAVNGKGVIELKLAMSRADLPLSRHAWDIPAPIAPAVDWGDTAVLAAGEALTVPVSAAPGHGAEATS